MQLDCHIYKNVMRQTPRCTSTPSFNFNQKLTYINKLKYSLMGQGIARQTRESSTG